MTGSSLDTGGAAVTLPLPRSWPWYSQEVQRRVAAMIAAGDTFAFGRHHSVSALEEWARGYFGRSYALAVSSGTAALASAYFGLGIGPGDEVLVPSYTFHATATPLLALGARPVLYDCEPASTRPDLDDLSARITPATSAICVVHMFGLPADMGAVRRLASSHGLAVVEDAAQAHGARIDGQLVGTLSDVGCFSIGGQKMVTGGFGGLLLTDNREIYDRALVYGHAHERALEELDPSNTWYGPADTGYGGNLRIHPIAAELALSHCRTLNERIAVRGSVLDGLTRRLQEFPFLDPPFTPANCSRGGWYGYKVSYNPHKLAELPISQLVDLMRVQGLKVAQPTTRPLHQTWMFQHRDIHLPRYDPDGRRPIYSDRDLPNAARLYAHTISFPDKHLHQPADDLLDQYVEGIRRVVAAVERSM